MRIAMTFDGREYAGSPEALVEKLRRDALHMKTTDIEKYMQRVAKQLNFEIAGDTVEQRCADFLRNSAARGFLRVLVRS